MRLQKLAGLERKKIEDELKEVQALIEELETLLKSPKKLMELIKAEIKDVVEKYGDDRRTKIVKRGATILLNAEDLVADEESVLVLTSGGYIKRTNPGEYRRQKRGGVGVVDLDTKEEDFVTQFLTANAHSDLLFFSDRGKVYQLKMYELPEGRRATKGKSIMNFISLEQGEQITSILSMPKEKKAVEGLSLIMATRNGTVKRVAAKAFHEVRRSGLIAIGLDKGDALIAAQFVHKGDDVIMTTTKGQSIRFLAEGVREMGRQAGGVRGMKLGSCDAIVGSGCRAQRRARCGTARTLFDRLWQEDQAQRIQNAGPRRLRHQDDVHHRKNQTIGRRSGRHGRRVNFRRDVAEKAQTIRTGLDEIPLAPAARRKACAS